MSFEQHGKVVFAGAGPGDPSLITVKAAGVLSRADVIIVDRLVSEELLALYANPSAQIIFTGKQGRSGASTEQQTINELLVKMASKHKLVVRLKGGDVSVFSNIMDELETLVNENIPYEIIPGITALSGAAAYTGIPLTARGLATGVRILTYYKHTIISPASWKELAAFNDTLVFYMSGNTLPDIVTNLLHAGADANIPFVVVEQATTPNQFVHRFTLSEFANIKTRKDFISPSLVIIGNVVSLHEKFAWLTNAEERVSYFTLLPEINKLITEGSQKTAVTC